MLKKVLKFAALALGVVLAAGAIYAAGSIYKFNQSLGQVYEVPPPTLAATTDPVMIERGRHLAESVAGCASADCHGSDLSGGSTIEAGPVGRITAPNLTPGSRAAASSDGEI